VNSEYQQTEIIQKILKNARTIAVVGLSDNPSRPSYDVASFLQSKGFKIIPVNPKIEAALGEKSFPDLSSVPGSIDVVDIFRRSEDVGPVVAEAIERGARAVWMQLGIVNDEAADRASEAGLDVVMDRCMKIEYRRLHP
jgi:predicted CoA-binding protein